MEVAERIGMRRPAVAAPPVVMVLVLIVRQAASQRRLGNIPVRRGMP